MFIWSNETYTLNEGWFFNKRKKKRCTKHVNTTNTSNTSQFEDRFKDIKNPGFNFLTSGAKIASDSDEQLDKNIVNIINKEYKNKIQSMIEDAKERYDSENVKLECSAIWLHISANIIGVEATVDIYADNEWMDGWFDLYLKIEDGKADKLGFDYTFND